VAPGIVAVLESDRPVEVGEAWEVLKVKRYGGTVVTVARPAIHPANRKGDT